MSDHDFEKRVKQKMDELKFTPSEAVWQAVQSNIRKDRPRRRGWVFIPVLLAGLGVTGYFLFNNNKKADSDISYQTTNSTRSISKTSDNLSTPDKTTLSDNPSAPDNSTLSDNSSSPDNKTLSDNSSVTDNSSPSDNSTSPHNSSTSDNSSVADNSSSSDNSSSIKKTNNSDKKTSNDLLVSSASSKKTDKNLQSENNIQAEKNHKTIRQATVPPVLMTNRKKPGSAISNNKNTTDLVKQNTGSKVDPVAQIQQQSYGTDKFDSTGQIANVGDQQQIIQPDSALAAKPVLKSDRKNDSSGAEVKDLVKSRKKKTGWDWGLNISGGVSNINDGPLTGVLKSNHMADAASSPQASNNFLFAPSPAGIPPAKPSEVKAGLYFSIGGFVTKQLSRTFSVSAGLQYNQYNTIIEVGYRVDSSRLVNNGSQVQNVARYYRADDNSKFSNKYHFIELPLTLHTRITGSKSFPLFWNAGIHLSQMIGSNALVFDSGTGVYYKDKSTLNKTQVGFATGFTVGLFGKSKTPMLIGPSVKYNASEMFSKDILGGKHLISAGLDLRILLNKK